MFTYLCSMANDPKKFKFPTSFVLFGHRYRVVFSDDLYTKHNRFGDVDSDAKLIRVQTSAEVTSSEDNTFTIPDSVVVETFLHELVHAVLAEMEEDSLYKNEKFVGLFGRALLEVYLSSTYNEINAKSEA